MQKILIGVSKLEDGCTGKKRLYKYSDIKTQNAGYQMLTYFLWLLILYIFMWNINLNF